MKGCGPQSKGSRNPEKKGAIHSFSKHFVMSKIQCLVLGTQRLRPGLKLQGATEGRGIQPLHREGKVDRLPGEHRGGVQLDRGLREGCSDEGVRAEALLESGQQD